MNLPAISTAKVSQNQDISKILNLAAPIGGIIASFLILVLIIWPKVNEIMELRTTNEQLVGRAENLESKAQTLSSLDQDLLEEQLAASEQILPSDKGTFSVLRQVENAAGLSGVLLNKIEAVAGTIGIEDVAAAQPVAKNSTADSGARSVQIRLAVTSDYQSLLQFLSSLYAFSRVVTIDAIALSASVGETLQLRASFAVDAHWKTLPQNLGSIEAPVQKLTQNEEALLKDVTAPEIIPAPIVPDVPKGRGDLFTPF